MLDILAITGPIFLCIALGYLTTRGGLFDRGDMRVFGKFLINLALPALLFNALSQRSVGEIFNGPYLAAYALGGLIMLAGTVLWYRKVAHEGMARSAIMAMGMTCPNSGYVGYPVMLLTLGAPVAGVALALNMVVENLLIIPILLALADMERHEAGHWRQLVLQTLQGLARNPLIIAIVAGFLVSALGIPMPSPVSRTVTLFAQASSALSLFVIGGSLVGLKLQGLRTAVAQIGVGKLVLHPLCLLAVMTWLVPIGDPQLKVALLLTGALPTMGIYAILAQRHGHEGLASAALLVGTLASFFTLSGLLWLLRHSAGWLG
ncbi:MULTISPECIES: AEC family transporter [Hydrogenophaga]|jgi:predicted permease|uniref:Putative transporter YfdV n=1 Tax=Hydrogenophaga pseudoflava TaxID=47421 RepID=A0A4V1ABE0_HYDPS|nr:MULTISPECIES: AEC family transporter [Hydrogenophaga]QBM27633.1 putative transporter YfdV [Hydrogenophaga pseudoflava]